jgi:hypothetical protein
MVEPSVSRLTRLGNSARFTAARRPFESSAFLPLEPRSTPDHWNGMPKTAPNPPLQPTKPRYIL